MPVVVNEFEVLAEAPPPQAAGSAGGGADTAAADATQALQPADISTLLRALDANDLRAWAH